MFLSRILTLLKSTFFGRTQPASEPEAPPRVRPPLSLPVSERRQVLEEQAGEVYRKTEDLKAKIGWEQKSVEQHLSWGSGDEWIVELRIEKIEKELSTENEALANLKLEIEEVRQLEFTRIAAAIQTERLQRNLDQATLADTLKLDVLSIQGLENGAIYDWKSELTEVIDFLDIDLKKVVNSSD